MLVRTRIVAFLGQVILSQLFAVFLFDTCVSYKKAKKGEKTKKLASE